MVGHARGDGLPLNDQGVILCCRFNSPEESRQFFYEEKLSRNNPTRRRPRIFYGWRMVTLGGFLTSLNKTAVVKGFPVFIIPVGETFGAGQATVSFVFALANSAGGPTGPMAGWLIDRYGPRAAVLLGAIMGGIGFLMLGHSPNIWAFALVYLGLVTLGSNVGFSYAMSALVNNWFYRRKALAMSSFQAIDSGLPAILVPVLGFAISVWGWQSTSTAIGIILLLVIPPLALWIKNTPESMGLSMDGDRGFEEPEAPSTQRITRTDRDSPTDYTVRGALRSPSYWMLLFATSLRLGAKGGVIVLIIPILVSQGTDLQGASYLYGLLLLVTMPLYLMIGWLADRFPKNLVLAAAVTSGTMSYALIASPLEGLGVIMGFVFLFGIADACAPTNWAFLGEQFGRKSFGQLRGFVQLAQFPGALAAPVFAGWWADHHSGSYSFPIWIFTMVMGLSALIFAVMRKPSPTSVTEASGLGVADYVGLNEKN